MCHSMSTPTARSVTISRRILRMAPFQIPRAWRRIGKNWLNSRPRRSILGRLKKYDEAKEWIDALVKEFPDDAESWALLGRIEKDGWVDMWRRDGKTSEEMCRDAVLEEGSLREAINAYATGYRKDPMHYYSGINAVTLLYVQSHLTGKDERPGVRMEMEGGVRWDVRGALEKDPKDYWARVTLA